MKEGNQKPIFGALLKELRKKAGYKTQEIFANAFGRSLDTIQNWEQGKTWPPVNDFIELCDFFGCDMDYLTGRIEQKTHNMDYLCAETGLSAEAVDALKAIRKGTMGGDDLRIVSEILKSPKLPDLIQSVKDAQWAKDEVVETARVAFNERSDPEDRLIAIDDLPGRLRFLRSFRFEVSEGAASILNEILQIDDTIYLVETKKKILDLDDLKREAEHEH